MNTHPKHIAIIMDGNGRWAQERGLPRIAGHEAGSKSIERCVQACLDTGVQYLTLYAFSSENWKRPALEVNALMLLLENFLNQKRDEMVREGIRLHHIGRIQELPSVCQRKLREVMEATASNTKLHLVLALSYSGRAEIVDAVKSLVRDTAAGTVSEADNTWFTLLTMNTHPLHFDAEYAKHSEFGRCIVASPLTLAIIVGMSVTDVSQKAIANLGWKEIRMTAPVFAGDTLYAETEVLGKRESASRPTAGLVTVRTLGRNQHGTVVCDFERTILVAKRGHAVEDRAGA